MAWFGRRRRAERELADAIWDLNEQIRRQNDFHERVGRVSGEEAVRALADVISGELGPRVALRNLTPGAGPRVALTPARVSWWRRLLSRFRSSAD